MGVIDDALRRGRPHSHMGDGREDLVASEQGSKIGVWSDVAAEIWQKRFEPQRGPLFQAVAEATRVSPGSSFLDAGCGGGGVALAAHRAGARVFGCDISDAVLATARRKVPAGEFKVGNLAALPYSDDSFETVVACDCLLSPKDARSAVLELSRVCAPAGQVCIVVWGEPKESDYSRVFDAMQSLLPTKPTVTPLAVSDIGVLDSLIAEAGLRIRVDQIVKLDYRFISFDDFWSCARVLGGIKLIAEVAGEEKVRATALQASRPCIREDGALVMKNTYRLIITNAKPQ